MSSYGKNPPLPIPKPILISFLEERGGGILTRPGAMRQGRWVWAVMGISHPWTLVDPLVQHRSHSEHLPGAAFDPPSITTLPSFGGKFLMQKRDGGNRFVPWKSIWSGWGEQCWWWLVGEAPGCFRGDDDKETASKTMVAKWNLIWIVLNRWLRCELCLDWIKLSWSIFQNAQFQAVPYEQHPLCVSICRILRVYCKPRLGDCGELITSQIHWSGWIVCLSTPCPPNPSSSTTMPFLISLQLLVLDVIASQNWHSYFRIRSEIFWQFGARTLLRGCVSSQRWTSPGIN